MIVWQIPHGKIGVVFAMFRDILYDLNGLSKLPNAMTDSKLKRF